MTTKEVITYILAAVFALLSWLGKAQIDNLYERIREVKTHSEIRLDEYKASTMSQNVKQWEKLSKLECEMSYHRGYHDGMKGTKTKTECP